MNDEKIAQRSSGTNFVFIAIFTIILVILLFLLIPRHHGRPARNIVCVLNLRHFGLVFQMYAQDNSNSYPTLDKWCDILSKGWIVDDNYFHCPGAERAKCNYAINPYCEPNSPPDTVLLFETKGGWNLSGGPELLTTENHGGIGCYVLFNDGRVELVRKESIGDLKWSTEEKNE